MTGECVRIPTGDPWCIRHGIVLYVISETEVAVLIDGPTPTVHPFHPDDLEYL